MQNVTGQRTRHLVAGTLDPIVGIHILIDHTIGNSRDQCFDHTEQLD